MSRMKLTILSSKYGAPMGRSTRLPVDPSQPIKLRMERLRWVDHDYDQGGAYWGGGMGDHVYWATDTPDGSVFTEKEVDVFVRAKSRSEAKAKIREQLPAARFYN